MSGKSAEQQARDLLEQCGVEDAQSFTAGDVVALANFIADAHRIVHGIRRLHYDKGDGWCSEDGFSWPCHTIRVVEPSTT